MFKIITCINNITDYYFLVRLSSVYFTYIYYYFSDKPKVTSRPASSYTSTKGLALTLPCSFDHTSVNPTWTFTDRSGIVSTINASEVEQTGYTIKDISDVNEGNYTCMASNKYGDEILNTEISLVISKCKIYETKIIVATVTLTTIRRLEFINLLLS